MKFLGILTNSIGGRLTSNSMFEGFRQLGHSVEAIDTLHPLEPTENSYDFVLGYDFSAIEYKTEHNLDIPTINYFSDVITSPAAGKKWEVFYPELNKNNNHSFCWDKKIAEKEGVVYLPHFVDCETYKNLSLKSEYDIMFAGRLDTDLRLNMFSDLVKSLKNLNFAWFAIEKHFSDALSRTDDKALIKKVYKGFIDNERDMAQAINLSKIVINVNSQGTSSLNYRTFQTAACQKLVLSDFREDLSLFDGSIPYYSDLNDLKCKIRFYLEHPTQYASMTAKAAKIVRQNHNSKDCAELILEKISG